MTNGNTYPSAQRAWSDMQPSAARSRTNRRRQLTDEDQRIIITALEGALAQAWLPMFQIMSQAGLPTDYVETQVRRVLDEQTMSHEPRFRVHTADALPANYWTAMSNPCPFTCDDIIVRRKRRDRASS